MKKLLLLTLAAVSLPLHAEDISTLVEGPGPVMPAFNRHTPLSGPLEPSPAQELPTPGLDDTQKNLRIGMATWKNLYSTETRTTIQNLLADLKTKFATLFPEETQTKVKAVIEEWKTKLEQSPEKVGDFINSIRESTPIQVTDTLHQKLDEFEAYFKPRYRSFIEKMAQQDYEKRAKELENRNGN